MARGCTHRGFRWVAAGVAIALHRGMTAKLHQRKNCTISVISATPNSVHGSRVSDCGIQYDSACVLLWVLWRAHTLSSFRCATYVNGNIFLLSTVFCSSILLKKCGLIGIRILACSAWPSVLWQRTSKEGIIASQKQPRAECELAANRTHAK